jgi:hypothetical protein
MVKRHFGSAKRRLLELCLGLVRLAKCHSPAHSKAKQNNNQIMGLLSNHAGKIIIVELKMVVLAAYDSIQLSNHGLFF